MNTTVISLWDGEVPAYSGACDVPVLTHYKAKNKRSRGAILIFPGGGYLHLAPHEGEDVDAIDEIDAIPNASILCYPVIDMVGEYTHLGSRKNLLGEEQMDLAPSVSPQLIADELTPPAFLMHTAEDSCVNVNNSYIYASKLRSMGIPVEMHVFPFGKHGLGLGDATEQGSNPHMAQWGPLLINWLRLMEF